MKQILLKLWHDAVHFFGEFDSADWATLIVCFLGLAVFVPIYLSLTHH